MLDISPLQSALGALTRALSVTGSAQHWQQFDAETQEALKAHTYNSAIAQAVFGMAPVFAQQARRMLLQLEQRND